MLYLKAKISKIDVNILEIADKFQGFESVLAKVDEKFERLKDKILNEGNTPDNSVKSISRIPPSQSQQVSDSKLTSSPTPPNQ